MRILIASDKFKGTMRGSEVGEVIGNVFGDHECRIFPVADGGEGTAEIIGNALGGEWVKSQVKGPLGDMVDAGFFLVCDDCGGGGTAVIEMNSASGLGLVQGKKLDPWVASTHGTGELIIEARNFGVDRIILGIGGSATNDGGAGMGQALGVRFFDDEGLEISEIPERLMEVDHIFPEIRLDLPEIIVACDVRNSLLGEDGATRVYGEQKGIIQKDMERQEARLLRFADLVESEMGNAFRDEPGAGAAGGLGFGLMSFCEAELRSGFDLVAESIDLEGVMASYDLIITGEGCMDSQSLMGKAPYGVAKMARKLGKPVVAICGCVYGAEALENDFDIVLSMVDEKTDMQHSMSNPREVLKNKVDSCRQMIEQLVS
jgi:glycerate kinase|tara:strand:- start:228 stop:1349 length:1122 start_codon:yes stop_codon:yes gene_type:complete